MARKSNVLSFPSARVHVVSGIPVMDVRLVKGKLSRRFWIRPGRTLGAWSCQVFFEGPVPHRATVAEGLVAAHRVYAEYQREIASLREDGWTYVDQRKG